MNRIHKILTILLVSMIVTFVIRMYMSDSKAQTVYTQQSNLTQYIPGGLFTGIFSANNPQGDNTLSFAVSTQRTACFDVALTDANSSITSIDMHCWGSRAAAGPYYRLPVLTSTTAAGISTSVDSTWRQTATTGLAPGTSAWVWCVTNIPTPFIICDFLANGVITAAVDTIDVWKRTIIP